MTTTERFNKANRLRITAPVPLAVREAVMKSHAGWVWHGYPTHFISGMNCAFHLGTSVERSSTRITASLGWFLVSTVGHLRRDHGEVDTLGAGRYDFFETMVFRLSKKVLWDVHGNPNYNSGRTVKVVRYPDSVGAELGHYLLCHRFSGCLMHKPSSGLVAKYIREWDKAREAQLVAKE